MTEVSGGHDQREHHRQPEAVDHPRQHVAGGVVGAQPVPAVGRRRRDAADVVDGVVGIGDERPEHPAAHHRLALDEAGLGLGHRLLGVVEAQLGPAGADQALHLGVAIDGLGAEVAAEGGLGVELKIGV
jgi:hypothetical protein